MSGKAREIPMTGNTLIIILLVPTLFLVVLMGAHQVRQQREIQQRLT